MRTLSEQEKKIIDRIYEGYTHISVILTDHIPDLLLQINRDADVDTAEFIFPNTMQDREMQNTATHQTKVIISIITFLEYLQEEGYILTGYFSHGQQVNPLTGLQQKRDEYNNDRRKYSVYWPFTDNRMKEYIFKYTDLTIIPTQHLREFKTNGYRTKDDVRFGVMRWISIAAILVSLTLGIMSLYISRQSDNPTKQQVDTVIKRIELMRQDYPTKQQMDSIIKLSQPHSKGINATYIK